MEQAVWHYKSCPNYATARRIDQLLNDSLLEEISSRDIL